MYNSRKNVSQVEQSQAPVRKTGELERDVGSKVTDFQMICEIGRGSYGVVYRVLSLVDKNEYVMKKINMKHIKLKNQKEALKEAQILKKVRNSYVVRFYASFIEEDHLYIIMELAEGGDLAALIKQHKERRKNFSEQQIWDFAWELCNAIDYLHNNNIIHRDIKTLNVFLTKDSHIKLGDLGVSKIVSSAASLQGTRVGTPLYLSPELVKQLPYDFKVDIWALGCVLYHLAALEPPFIGDNLITLGYNIVHKSPKALPTVYSQKLVSFIMRFLEKNPSSRPRISEMYDQFPLKYRENPKEKISSALSSAPNTAESRDQIVHKVEYHNQNSAKMLKVEDPEPIKKEDIQKSAASCISPTRTNMPNTSARPVTAGLRGSGARDNQPLGELKANPTIENRINLHTSHSPPKMTTLVRQKTANPPSPKRATPLVEDGNGNFSAISKREVASGSLLEIFGLNQDQKGGLFDRKHQDTESTVENKGRTVQMQMANPSGNDTTLSAKQAKESDNLKKASKKQEQNVIIEENVVEKKSYMAQRRTPVEVLKGSTPNTSVSGIKERDIPESKKTFNPTAVAIKSTNVSKQDGIEKEIGFQTPPFSKLEAQQPTASQRPESRPGTSEAAMRVIMNPLIKSTSPRFKINSRFNQAPGFPSSFAKQDNIFGSNGAIKPRENVLQQKSTDSKEVYFGKDVVDSKEDFDDLTESLEAREDIVKKKQIPGKGNEIRIRPVSAHILKGVSNNLGQNQEDKTKKDLKPIVNKIEKAPEQMVSSYSNNKIPVAKPLENYIAIKTDGDVNKGPAALRPKSAVFAGRLNGKGMQFNREQADNALKNLKDSELQNRASRPAERRQIMGGFATVENEKRLSMYDRPKTRNNDLTASREEVEEGDMLNGQEKKLMSMYGGFLQANNFMRFEFLGKSGVKNTVETVKKTDPGDEWENKIAEIKGLREPSGRPMTAVSQKKRLTIHDLK